MNVFGKHWIKWTVRIGLLIVVLGVTAAVGSTAVLTATPLDGDGYLGPDYESGVGVNHEVTAEKPESKLWYHDGSWWGSIWSSSGSAYHIHKLDWDTQTWEDTGVVLDDRKESRADVLSDGNTLYVASHVYTLIGFTTSAGNRGELYRYTYSDGTYALDSGFPVEVNQAKTKSLTVAKDSTGVLWLSWLQGDQVMVTHSDANGGGDDDWATPYEIPGTESTITSQDISAIVAYDGHIGVMFSDQKGSFSMKFAVHEDGDDADDWTLTEAYSTSGDDHISMRSLQSDPSGKIFAVVKTSINAELIQLLVCDGSALTCSQTSDWTSYTVYDQVYSPTRSTLVLDSSNRDLYIFSRVKVPSIGSQEMIYFKKTDIDNISFDTGPGEPFITSSTYRAINNPTTTKQSVTHNSGLVVMAADDQARHYVHNCIDLGALESDVCQTTDFDAGVRFDSSTYTVSETGGSEVQATVVLSGEVPNAVTVNYTITAGTATAGEDYTATDGTLTFPPGTSEQTITFNVLDDTIDELDETLTIALSNASGLALQDPSTAVVTITDDDDPPTVQFESDSFVTSEAAASKPITMTLSTASGQAVTVNFATSNDTAGAGGDYLPVGATVTFPPGVTSKSIEVPIVDNDVVEPLESFFVTLSAPTAATLGMPEVATVTIQDDDALPVVSLSNAQYSVDEGVGTLVIPVDLIGLTTNIVTVDVVVDGGDADADIDYVLPMSTTLSFPPGSTTKSVTVSIIDDLLDEGDESIDIVLTNLTNSDPGLITETEVVITDNDDPPLASFTSATYSADEATEEAVITVVLDAPSARTATVDYEVTAGTAVPGEDFIPITGTLTYPAGTVTETFTVELIDNLLFEFEETVNLRLTDARRADLGTPSEAVLTITDADGLPIVSFDSEEATVSEDQGTVVLPVSLSEEGGLTGSVVYTTYDITAIGGSDYTPQSRPLFFGAGDDKGQIVVPLFDDGVFEESETFRVELSDPVNLGLGATTVMTITITDNDAPKLLMAETDVTVQEDHGNLLVEVILEETLPYTATVEFIAEDLSAEIDEDYSLETGNQTMTGTLTFVPGELSKIITVPIVDDPTDEPFTESFAIHLINAVDVLLGSDQTTTVTIEDNDEKPFVSFAQATYEVPEDASEVEVTLVLTNPSTESVRVTAATVDDTAEAGHDYTAIWERVRFNYGSTEETITVPIHSDDLEEGNEQFEIIIGDPSQGDLGTIKRVTIIIVDEDTVVPETFQLHLPIVQNP